MVEAPASRTRGRLVYDRWIESLGVPIHRGHFVENLKTAEVAWWEERQCGAAFLQLQGMEGISEGRITEIPPGKTLPPLKLAVGETVYVLDGNGLASVWAGEGPKKSFEWQKSSMFHVPRYSTCQLSNARGGVPARLLHYNYLPMAMTIVPDPDFFFDNPYEDPSLLYGLDDDPYSQAKAVLGSGASDASAEQWGAVRDENAPPAAHGGVFWSGSFFPNMAAWDKLSPWQSRGGGGTNVQVRFPSSGMSASMSVFDPGRYKKAHAHGPGRVIVIPSGEGYSVLWPPDGEKVVCPWGEASVFTPPGNWFHQHFNVGQGDARYLKFGHLPQFAGTDLRMQIEYPDEQPWIREKFEEELAKHGSKSSMPAEAYADRDFQWSYGDDD